MNEPEFTPIVNPWVEKQVYSCMTDTLYFDDHSIMNYAGASWHWAISPAPAYMENPDIRNPKVVLGSPGSYDVSLTVTKNGQTYTRNMPSMVTTTSCPSIYDCNNPDILPKDIWNLLYVDSEELNDPGYAWMSFDGNPGTIWHTCWSTGNDPYPHEIRIDLGQRYKVSKFTYLTRQDSENGRIKDYRLYLNSDTLDWGNPVKTGSFVNTSAPQSVSFDTAVPCRYFRLVALNEVNGNPWASAAEFSLTGCVDYPAGSGLPSALNEITAYPVPTGGSVTLDIPKASEYKYEILDQQGRLVGQGNIPGGNSPVNISLHDLPTGLYFILISSGDGQNFRAKVLKGN
jgi:PKD repeat protein